MPIHFQIPTRVICSLAIAFVVGCSTAPKTAIDSQLGKVVSQNKHPVAGAPEVFVFKQWHLSPSQQTIDIKATQNLPQAKNQRSIYLQLKKWIVDKKLDLIVAEGCQGELDVVTNSGIKTRRAWNGWTRESLRKWLGRPEYADILTHVPLKLSVEFGDSVRTVCGDDDDLVKESALALSDVRGATGFLERISIYPKDPQRANEYLTSLKEVYHQDARMTWPEAVRFLNGEIKKNLQKFNELVEARNQKVIELLTRQKFQRAAIVFGGLHARGLEALLTEKGYAAEVIEPMGYSRGENALLEELDRYTHSN